MPFSPTNLPDLVIFDNDGVLIDSEIIAAKATSSALSQFDVHMSPDEAMHTFVGMDKASMKEKLVQMKPGLDVEGLDLAIHKAFRDQADTSLEAIDGAIETVAAIKAANIPVCVCSNASLEWIVLTHKKLGLYEHFSPALYFNLSMVKRGKPLPQMHALALDSFGVKPENALVIEDTTSGAGGAHANGIPVWGFVGATGVDASRKQELLDQGAVQVFDTHKDLRTALLGPNSAK